VPEEGVGSECVGSLGTRKIIKIKQTGEEEKQWEEDTGMGEMMGEERRKTEEVNWGFVEHGSRMRNEWGRRVVGSIEVLALEEDEVQGGIREERHGGRKTGKRQRTQEESRGMDEREGEGKRVKEVSVEQRDADISEATKEEKKYRWVMMDGVRVKVLRSCCIDDINPLMIKGRLSTTEKGRGEIAIMTVDTGAVAQCMDFLFACKKAGGEEKLVAKEEEELGLYSASGKKLKERGSACFCVEVGGVKSWCQFTLVEGLALDVILGCGWQEEQRLVIDWEHKVIQPKDGMCVPFIQVKLEGGKLGVGCVIPEARDEMKLYPVVGVCVPGRGVRCVGFEARGAWEGVEKKVGYVRGLGHKRKYMLAEGLAILEEGVVWVAVSNPYPHPVHLDPKDWMGMMTLCKEDELDSIWVRKLGKETNMFGLGGARIRRDGEERGVAAVKRGMKEVGGKGDRGSTKKGNEEGEWSEEELAEDCEWDEYERMRYEELREELDSAEGFSIGSEKPWDKLELGGEMQSQAYMEGLVGTVLATVGSGFKERKRMEWNKKGLDGAFGKEFGFVLERFDLVGTTLGQRGLTKLLRLLVEYRDVWEVEKGAKIKRTTRAEHKILLKEGTVPFKDHVRKTPWVEDQIMHKHITEMSLRGVIRPSKSPWASAVQLVDKKDGKVRFCVDYRKLNKLTIKDSYPLPRINDILNKMGGARFYSTMDLSAAFWSIPIAEEDRHKSAFTTKFGLWEWCSMPFGLTNAPATQQRFMEAILSGFTWEFCMVYVDDIVVWSETEEEHVDRLRLVLERIRQGEVYLNPAKCSFAKSEFEVLGHLCTKDGVGPNPKKVQAVVDYPAPKNRPALRRFLGLAGWVSRFIRNYSRKTQGLRRLLAGEELFVLKGEDLEEFEQIKKDLIEPPVLVYPDFKKQFHIHVDSSIKGMGAVLTQKDKNGRHMVIAYASAATTKTMLRIAGMSVSVLECLGVVWAVNRFREYVHGQEFWVYTDHQALVHTLQKPSRSKTLDRLAAALMECDMHVMHIPGSKMLAADAISRAEYDHYHVLSHAVEPEYMGLLDVRIALPGGVEEEEEEDRAERERVEKGAEEEGFEAKEELLGEQEELDEEWGERQKKRSKLELRVDRIMGTEAGGGKKVVSSVFTLGEGVLSGKGGVGGGVCSVGRGKKKRVLVDEESRNRRVMAMARRAVLPMMTRRRVQDVQDEEEVARFIEKEKTRVGDCAEPEDRMLGDWCLEDVGMEEVSNGESAEEEEEDKGIERGNAVSEEGNEEVLVSDEEEEGVGGVGVDVGEEDEDEKDGAAILDSLLEGSGMAEQQRRDPWLKALMHRIKTGELPDGKKLRERVKACEYKYGLGYGGILKRVDLACLGIVESPVVIPPHLVDLLLLYMHEDPLAGHLGITKTYSRIKERFYWEGMYKTVREHVRTCVPCQRNKDGRLEVPPPGIDSSLQGYPGITLQLDYTVAHKTIRRNSHILNIIDRFTRFSKFYATSDPDGEASAVILMDYIATFGCPVRIISDNGTEFDNKLIAALTKFLGVNAVTVSEYNPRANGQVERPWKTLKEIMRAYVTEKQDNWDVLLPLFQLAMNSAISETTGYAPFFLMMGRRAILPVEVHLGVVGEQELGKGAGEYVKLLKANMRWVFELVRGKVEQAQRLNMLKRMDREVVKDTVMVGDLVLIKSQVKKKGLNKKLLARFSRIVYRVVEKVDAFRIKLVNIATRIPLVGYINVCRVKKFYTKKLHDLGVEEEWVVSRIRAQKDVEGIRWYLIEWEGYTDRQSTWEKETDVTAPELVRAWKRSILDGSIAYDQVLPEREKGVMLKKKVPILEGGDGRRRHGDS
jgi:hypothetical protein